MPAEALINLFIDIHGDGRSENDFLEWKKMRSRNKSYITSLKKRQSIKLSDDEWEELADLIDTASMDEMKRINIKDLKTGKINLASLRRRIVYPKSGLEEHKRLTFVKIVTVRKTKEKEPDEVRKAKERLRINVWKKCKAGMINEVEKEKIYQWKKTATLEEVLAHKYYPKPKESTVKIEHVDGSKKLYKRSVGGGKGGQSPIHGGGSSSEGSKSDSGERDLSVRCEEQDLRELGLPIHSPSKCGHNTGSPDSSDEGDSSETPECKSVE